MVYRYILDLADEGLIRKGKALDLGCGPGTASTLLSSLGFEVDAVDKIGQFIPEANNGGNIMFYKEDIRDYSISENAYDFIHARNVLHFLKKEEITTTIQRMLMGLKIDGVMYFNVSGDKDGWKDKSKNVTFLTDTELVDFVESVVGNNGPIYNKLIRLGFGTTTTGIRKYTHTISYTIVKK